MMQGLSVRARNYLCNALHIASSSLQQPAQITTGLGRHVASPEAEKKREFLAKRQEPRSQLLQGSWGIVSLLPVMVLSGEEALSASVSEP